MQLKEAIPKDAAAVVLLRENAPEVYLAQRNPSLKFLGGWHAFPGGKVDREDAEITVKNCADAETAKFIVCAVRETFEEIGVLLVRGADKITKGQRASLRDDLISGRFSFAEILESWGLWIDAEDFRYTGFWTTPAFSPVRFKTRFFIVVCPRRQDPETNGEFIKGAFLTPGEALASWENSEILISPPVLISLQILAGDSPQRRGDAEKEKSVEKEILETTNEGTKFSISASPPDFSNSASLGPCGEKLLAASQAADGVIRHLKLNPYITVFPLRTETLPPATHTNCFVAGEKEFVVIDPASPFEDEQNALHEFIDSLVAVGRTPRELILTHLHRDHVSGANALQKHLRQKHGLSVGIAAHRATAESLRDSIAVERFIEDGEIIELSSSGGEAFGLKALHTPGHARGHLCFYDERRGFLLSGDNVVGTGSVLIAPTEGNMKDYLNSLDRMKTLPDLRFLCGAHGAAIFDAPGKIESYIRHRLERERKILDAVKRGAKTPREIVEQVYTDVSAELWHLAEQSVAAHLEKLNAGELSGSL